MCRKLSIVLVLSAWMCVPAPAQQKTEGVRTPITEADPVADALDRASKDRNYLWVVVNGDQAKDDCKHFDQHTLNAPELQAWMAHRVTLCKLDTSTPAGQQFAAKHGVEKVPTVVVMSSGGLVLGKHVGDAPPKRLLRVINATIQSDAIRGDRGMHSWAGEDVVLSISDHAQALFAQGKHEAAFQEYAWCLDHRATHGPLFPIAHLEELVGRVVALAEVYEPAMADVLLRLSSAEFDSLKNSRPNVYALYLIKYGYLALDREDKLITHYDRLKRRHPGSNAAPAFAKLIYRPLLRVRRYEELKHTVTEADEVGLYLIGARTNKVAKSETRKILAGRYEILLGIGKIKQAKDLAQQMLMYDRCAETNLELASAAYRSTRSTDENIQQVRSAYNDTGGENLQVVLVYAKLLAQRTQRDPEALQVLRYAIQRFEAGADKKTLRKCLAEIQAGKIPPRYSITGQASPEP